MNKIILSNHYKMIFVVAIIFLLFAPLFAFAFPFGGQASIVRPCFNEVIYASIGPPVAGPYIWAPSTKTYLFGPPRHSGQWLLGLASINYYCIVSRRPLITWPGSLITMLGTSQ